MTVEFAQDAVGVPPSAIESPRQIDVFDPADNIKLVQF